MAQPSNAQNEIPIDPVLLAESERARQAASVPTKKQQASWTALNEKTLMDLALERIAEAGEGANFTKTFWNSAAIEVNKGTTKGGPKTAETCKSKYGKLKGLFYIVRDITRNSGWAWDNELGACIGPANEGTWNAWVEKNPKAAPFRNNGWCHLEAFQRLIPDAPARGNHVFRPGSQATAVLPQSQPELDDENYDGHSIDWDLEALEKDKELQKESDDDSDKENEVVPKTPAPRKRAAADPATGTTKKPRTSHTGASALHDVADQITDFNAIFRTAFGPSTSNTEMPPTPVRLKTAIKRAQELETWMDKGKLVLLLEVLEASKMAVDVYDSLDDEDLRIMWVKRKVGIAS